MAELTSRERVLMAVNHEEPDRVPFIFGVDLTTGIMRDAYRDLKKLLGVEAKEQYMYGTWRELGSARVDEDVMRKLGSDGRGVWDRKPRHIEERNANRQPDQNYIDDFNIGHIPTSPEDTFPGVHPLTESTMDALESFAWPDMNDMSRFTGARERAASLSEENQYAVFAAPWLISPFERALQLQGMDTFLLNLALAPDFAQAVLAKLTDLYKQHLANFLAELDGNADIIILADDLGTQESLLMSPKMYRDMLKPLHADLISSIKAQADIKVFFHSDGDIFDLIDDLVEIGVDVLNPIQTSAGRMSNLPELKKRYGKNVAFCGAVDTHHILPEGTPAEVQAEVRRVIDILGPGGGYMVASVHSVMNGVPPENVVAMAEAVEQFGRYPLTG